MVSVHVTRLCIGSGGVPAADGRDAGDAAERQGRVAATRRLRACVGRGRHAPLVKHGAPLYGSTDTYEATPLYRSVLGQERGMGVREDATLQVSAQ